MTNRQFLERIIRKASTGLNLGDEAIRKAFLSDMLTVAARIDDDAEREWFVDRLVAEVRQHIRQPS